MARPTPIPYVPSTAPITKIGGLSADVWVLFFNKMVEFIASLTRRGLRADQPAATDVYPGTLYYVSDEFVTEKSNGEIWEDYTDGGGVLPSSFEALTTNPVSPVENQVWFFSDEATPPSLSIRWRHGGTTNDFPIGTGL